MKCFPRVFRAKWFGLSVATIGAALLVRAEFVPGSDDTVAGSALESALFRIMGLPDGTVIHSRPAWEAKKHLTELLQKSANDADLLSLRAREEELLQDYANAEADWQSAAEKSQDGIGARTELAAFYGRRNQPREQISALLELGGLPQQPDQRDQPPADSPQWKAFGEAEFVAHSAQLPPSQETAIYEAWIKRYPENVEPYQSYLSWQLGQKNVAGAKAVAARMKAAFPHNRELALTTDASLARLQGGSAAVLEVYARNFSPLWPESLRKDYFQELSSAHQLRTFLGAGQQQAEAAPTDLKPVTRLFFYYEQQGRKDVASQQLLALEARRSSKGTVWTASELRICGELFERVQDYDDSAHAYYQLYQLPTAAPPDKEFALASLINLLLDVPEQPLEFGSRDLSLYKNIGQMDRHPGFLNGILTLALNYTFPDLQYQNASQSATSYFHRASASRLIEFMQRRFPHSSRVPALEAKLFNVYAVYGQHGAIIKYVPAWLEQNQASPAYVDTALLLTDSYISVQNTNSELSLYDSLLTKLADKAEHMPIGAGGLVGENGATVPAHSQDYARVLDRYISRLVQLGRSLDAVALLRREIDHNPDDPGIYERLALFLEQNRLDSDLEQTYKQAFTRFTDSSWASKLARFYLRAEKYSDYEALTRQITDTFKGSAVAPFLEGVPSGSGKLAVRITLYAHHRFPQNLTFVRSLLAAYLQKETRDVQAHDELLRQYWFYAEDLRTAYFEELSRSGRLRQQLAALDPIERETKDSNLAALQLNAYGHAWLTEYETAAPAFARLAQLVPGDRAGNGEAITIERSLASANGDAFAAAIKFAQQDVSAAPADREAVVRVGEIYADREMYSQARPWWDRVASVQPGAAEGYLDSATVFWDYFQFGDALRVIEEARRKLHSPWQFSYEAGAIYENQGKFKQAVVAYVNGADNVGSTDAQARLLTLAGRKTTAELVEEATSRLTTGKYNSGTFQLRLAVLERQNRRPEIESLLSSALTHANGVSDIEEIRSAADRLGFERIAADAMERTIAVTTDPIEKLQAEIDLGHFYESHNNQGAAEREFSSALQANPERLGVIRAAVDFYWRAKQSEKAVQALLSAADRAQPPYQAELRREAAEKATNSGQFDTARRLLDELLANDPWNGDLLAEKAQTYARQNDAAGLVSFYASELDAMKHAPLEGPDKTNRVAALRRGYVAALIAVGNNTDALEQYQLIVNAYPEDTALIAEVSRFAENHQLSDRLVAYYSKAVSDAPHDYRWPIVLARIDTALRRYPEAIAAYDKASVVRPDRQDIFVAKADLQTRLLRFEDAMHTYAKLYELTFHNSSYLAAQADLNMRMGRPAEALKLLRAAYIDPHPHEAAGFLVVMRQELSWNNFDAVDQLFRELRDTAAKDSGWMVEGVNLEVQALMALHRPQDAIEIAAASLPSNAGPGSAATAIGQAAREYLTPQDKVQLAGFLQAGKAPPPFSTLQLAEAAGLYDLQAELVYKAALVHPDMSSSWPDLQRLQSARLLYEELGQQLDSIAQSRRDSREYGTIMQAAFQAFANAGDTQAELRLISYSGPQYPRLFLEWAGGNLTENVARLATISPRQADAVIQYLISDGSEAAVFESIAARGRSSGALWKNSYTAMAGLYLLSADARVPNAFEAVLGPRTVGGELTNQARQNSLEGGDWFYYASRFGEYLGHRGDAAREDFLPSAVEGNAAASDNYVQLAESYLDIKDKTLAMQALRDALQLSPDRGDVYDRLALLAIEDKERDKAIELWRKAFDLLAARVEQGPLPETYWSTAHNLLVHMNRFRLVSELRGPADEMLQAYARRNGAYRMNDILSGLFEDSPNRGTAVNWMIELSKLPNTDGLLGELLNARWIPEQDKEPLFQAELDARRKALAGAVGNQVDFARQELKRWLVSYISYLEKQKRWPDAWSVLQQIQPAEDRPAVDVVIAAAMTGRLDNLLSGYRAKPESAPSNYEMLNAAQTLEDDGQHEAALALKDFEYSRELQAETSAASAWFGLAEVRFEQKRNEEGLQLIRDVTLTVGEPFSNLGEAIRVLEQNGLLKEAADYSKEWTTAEPWNNEARLTRARLESDSHKLDDLRTSSSVPYRLRVQAAELLREHKTPFAGTDELTLLTHDSIAAGEASRPYFIEARLQAAKTASEQDRIRLYRDAIAFDPSVREPRLYLAEAAFRAKEDQLGIVALDSYEQAGRIGNVKSNPEAVTVEQLAADAFMVQKNYSRAIRLYEDVLVHTTDSAIRDRTEKSLRAANEQRRIRNANLQRRPVVTQSVGQPHIVKPKLKSLVAGLSQPDEQGEVEEEQQ